MPVPSTVFPILFESSAIRLDANFFDGGSPGLADSQASDADAIGIYPVHARWTVVDGGDRRDVGRISPSPWPRPPPSRARRMPEPGGSPASHGPPCSGP